MTCMSGLLGMTEMTGLTRNDWHDTNDRDD